MATVKSLNKKFEMVTRRGGKHIVVRDKKDKDRPHNKQINVSLHKDGGGWVSQRNKGRKASHTITPLPKKKAVNVSVKWLKSQNKI